MLWALIISLILHNQLHGAKSAIVLPDTLEHTPGFYEIEAIRMEKYLNSMMCKVNSAEIKRASANKNMLAISRKNKPQDIHIRAFSRLCAANNNLIKAHKKYDAAHQDWQTAHNTSRELNNVINTIYALAYSSKTDLLKHQLSKIRLR